MRLRVRFAETDQMGIAHHSSYVLWMEAARVEWLRERGVSYREMERSGVSLAVSSVSVQYRAAAYFDDEVEVEAKLVERKSRRFRYLYKITRVDDGALLATGETTHTPVERSGRAIRLSKEWLGKLEPHLQIAQQDA